MYLTKRSAAIILFSSMSIAALAMGAVAGSTNDWMPRLKELEVMSVFSAILVNLITLAAIVPLFICFSNTAALR